MVVATGDSSEVLSLYRLLLNWPGGDFLPQQSLALLGPRNNFLNTIDNLVLFGLYLLALEFLNHASYLLGLG